MSFFAVDSGTLTFCLKFVLCIYLNSVWKAVKLKNKKIRISLDEISHGTEL